MRCFHYLPYRLVLYRGRFVANESLLQVRRIMWYIFIQILTDHTRVYLTDFVNFARSTRWLYVIFYWCKVHIIGLFKRLLQIWFISPFLFSCHRKHFVGNLFLRIESPSIENVFGFAEHLFWSQKVEFRRRLAGLYKELVETTSPFSNLIVVIVECDAFFSSWPTW